MPSEADRVTPLVSHLEDEVRRTVRSRSAVAVHGLRIAIRRVLQAIELSGAPRKTRKPLKHLLSLAGDVRDCDIALKLLAKPWAHAGDRLRRKIRARRDGARQILVTALRAWLESLAQASPARKQNVLAKATSALHEMAGDFLRRGSRAASKKARPADLHKFRIHAKELRYSIELLEPAVDPWIEQIRGVQSILGDINDCRAVRRLVRDLDGGGPVEAALRKRQRRKTREFRRLWEDQFETGTAKDWVRSLKPPERKPMGRSQTASAASQPRTAKRA